MADSLGLFTQYWVGFLDKFMIELLGYLLLGFFGVQFLVHTVLFMSYVVRRLEQWLLKKGISENLSTMVVIDVVLMISAVAATIVVFSVKAVIGD